ncbi:MAG: glycogen synthase GlgA [Ndongobacter sp.]|nr:glycogen synthase GlgA [Ndongobacter sp.]
MNILYVASEAAPFIKTGGLADVAGALPKALCQKGMDCRLVMPLYSQIADEYKSQMQKIGEFWIDLGWKHEYCGILTMTFNGVTTYFLQNDYYFNRASLYGEGDDAERFIFFSKGATRLPKVLDFRVDILHANDWHSALVPVFVNDYRTGDSFYRDVRTVLTIHNLKYQGQFAPEMFYWTNLSGYYMSDYDLKFYQSLNFLKGGIVHANAVNTVSKTYAEEISYSFFGEGLDGVVRAYASKFYGIVNGLDYDVWNPASDEFLTRTYDVDSVLLRKENKRFLQQRYGLEIREDVPMFAMITRLTAMKGLDLLRYVLEELLQEDVQIVVLGTGEETYEEMFRYFAWKYPTKCAARLYYSNEQSHQIYSAADFFLMPSISEPCGISQMIAMRYGAVPLVREAGGLRDTVHPYNKYSGEGTGFSFSNINAHELLFAMKEAIRIYREEPEALAHLQRNAMRERFDWSLAGEEYLSMYRSVLK